MAPRKSRTSSDGPGSTGEPTRPPGAHRAKAEMASGNATSGKMNSSKARTAKDSQEPDLSDLPDPRLEAQAPTEPQDPRSLLRTEPLDAVHAWLVLLPALVLAWPFPSLLAHDPVNAATAAGWTLWLALPAGVFAIVRGRIRWHWGLLALLFLFVRAAFTDRMGAEIDTFEASRGYVALVGMFTIFVSATGLGPVGRRTLGRGVTIVAALVLLGWFSNLCHACVEGDAAFRASLLGFDLRWTLGNPGDLAEALVPAALATLAVAVGADGPRRITLASLAGASAFAVTWSGSRAGWLVALGGAFLLVALRPGRSRSVVPALGILLGVLLALGGRSALTSLDAPRPTATPSEEVLPVADADGRVRIEIPSTDAAATDAAPTNLAADEVPERATDGGLAFRRLTWRRVPDLWFTAPWVGVGTGQFRRAFPPHRDPDEIRLSSHDRTEPTFVDVEHPHSDPLLVVAEYGLLGGAGFFVFLVWVLASALRQLVRGDRDRRAAALGVCGAFVLGLQNCGLFYGLVSPGLWMALAGSVIAAEAAGPRKPRHRDRLMAIVVLAFALWAAVSAGRLIGHGHALAKLHEAEVVDGDSYLEPMRARELVDEALVYAPNSPVALERLLPFLVGEDRRSTIDHLLGLRPNQRSVLHAHGVDLARNRRFAEARVAFERVLELDEGNPLAGLEWVHATVDLGDPADLEEALDRLEGLGQAVPARLRAWGATQLLQGRTAYAEGLLRRADPELRTTDPGVCYAASLAARERAETLAESARTAELRFADGLLVGAQLGFARNHVRGEIWDSAVTSYRQALRHTRDRPDLGFEAGAPIVLAELSAALWKAGSADEARERFEGVTLTAIDRKEHLAPWAEAVLVEAGLLTSTP